MNMQFDHIPDFPIIEQFGPAEQTISSLVYNSNDVSNGAAFFCVAGENTDGHLYIPEAIEKGAAAIIGSNAELLAQYAGQYHSISFIVVADVRRALAYASIFFFQDAKDRLIKVGVTGTNGKTTTATYVYNLFNLLGIRSGFIGTTGVFNSDGKFPYKKSTPTTPISSDIHQIFSQLVSHGDAAVSMEVSSIALDQKRVEGIDFDVAIHTNISEEHLEYHKTFEHYLNSKLLLFAQAKSAVVNLDDGMAEQILAAVDYPALSYSRSADSGADLIWGNLDSSGSGMRFDLRYDNQVFGVEVPLFGEYNAGNLTAAIAAALLSGASMEDILSVLPRMPQVEGRFQVIPGPEGRKIILDYAHTPVALDLVMREVGKLPHNRLIALIAGIGIRDFGKMPKMAKAAEGKADVIIVTVDHPDFNDPEDVVNEVLKGFTVPYKQQVVTAPTRKEAVMAALQESGPDDIVLLSSGCINGAQKVRGEFVPHSDEEIIEGYFQGQN
ncbi:UDP-N-acetylmuramoyl-L-alanyl-D-glutamate--2,6-diaminopimelate ligase [Planococcus sp. FY231025]|uniref:UDP-N-acetylmuramoyl-L-alanyl-D-glutamate--2, 6-diaminopimelate ligase n=1 Tax=Planococcus sp. FY231025 TaxID=3455699 RepID=UPI003F8E9125